MKKVLMVVLAIMLCATALAGCGAEKAADTSSKEETKTQAASDFDYIKSKGELVIGITDFAPMDYLDENGDWTGFDAELAKLVADKMGVSAKFIEIDWDNKLMELETKSIDCIWNGMTITDEIKKGASVSDPYVLNKQVVVMAKDKVDAYADVESLAGLKFAVEAGSAGENAAVDNEFEYVGVNAQTDALLELKSGKVDGCIIDATMAAAMTGEGTSYDTLKAGIALTEEYYGIAFRKDSDMASKVNEYIKELAADGTLKALSEKYNLTLVD